MLNLNDDSTIKRTLPESIAHDQTVNDICDSIQPHFSQYFTDTLLVLLLPRLDSLPEELLDELAWQYHVDFYRDIYPIETKRELVRTAIERHRRKGTPAAVEEMVRTVYQDSVVEEWFEYGGEPYWFRVLLSAGTPRSNLSMKELLALVDEYKSYRSHLEGVYYHIPHDIVIGTKFGWATYWGRVCGTYPYRRRYGQICGGDIVVDSDYGGLLYRNPHTNELKAGTFPKRSVQGDIIGGDGITANTAAGDTSYSARYCGSTLGGLM